MSEAEVRDAAADLRLFCDEAERAVRAGLATVKAVGRLRTPDSDTLAARVGIATGLVVVGDLVGEGDAREVTAVGETPNLAARLQQLAEPGTIVIADEAAASQVEDDG